jgi:hypothetical protein
MGAAVSLEHVTDPVRRLATLVSIAARIEPELLRAARLRLLPDVDASAEADLWFSDLVAARSTRRIVLDAAAAAELRVLLCADGDRLHAARRVVAEMHAQAPPAVQLEEELTYLALCGGNVAEAIEVKLTAVLSAIANDGRTGLVDWAARAIPCMPAPVQATRAAAALQLVVGGQNLEPAAYGAAFRGSGVLSALVARALPMVSVYARLIAGAVEIGRASEIGWHDLPLPKTDPLVVELAIHGQTEIVEIPREGVLLRHCSGDVAIRTVAGDVFELRARTATNVDTVRLLALTRLGDGELLDGVDIADPDIVLIAGDVANNGQAEEYRRVEAQLARSFPRAAVFPVPGPHDVMRMLKAGPVLTPFESFRERLGFQRTTTSDFARSYTIGNFSIGVAGINTTSGEDRWKGSFTSLQLARACGGDVAAWCRAHDFAVLVMHHALQDLDNTSLERWHAFGASAHFDLIVFGSRADEAMAAQAIVTGTPPLAGSGMAGSNRIELRRAGREVTATMLRTPGEKWWKTKVPARERSGNVLDKFPPRRVLVAGTAQRLPLKVQELSRAVGALLAMHGHQLLTGGFPGVDYLSAEGFEGAGGEATRITHYVVERNSADYPRGQKVTVANDSATIEAAVRAADVVIVIDGEAGTVRVAREALRQRKPLIPIGSGAAADVRREALSMWAPDAHERLLWLGHMSTVAATIGVVHDLINVAPAMETEADDPRLSEAPPFPDELSEVPEAQSTPTVFISYSRHDLELVDDFRAAMPRGVEMLMWDDREIEPGKSWRRAVEQALGDSRVAVVFASDSYLARDGRESELPRILAAANSGELRLYWFIVNERVDESLPNAPATFPPAHDPRRPLDSMTVAARRELFERVGREIARAVFPAT